MLRLAPPPRDPGPKIVTVEINAAPEPKAVEPKPPEPETPKPPEPTPTPPPKPKVASLMAKPEPTPTPPPPQVAAPTVSAETKTAAPTESNVLLPRRAAGVDLKLHSMPNGVIGGQYDGPPPTTAQPPRKEWAMKGTAGDPILGKLDEVKEDPYPLVKMSDGWVYKGPAFNAKIFLDGSVSFDDKNIRDFKGLSGSFDITELIMKGKKQDPYRREKEKFLTHTTDMRDRLIKKARDVKIANSLDHLRGELATVWHNTDKSPLERRAEIYAMWKEAAMTDKDLSDAGAEAQKIIEQFIRKYLPQGSDNAYSAEEIDRFNSRGKVTFNPYR